MKRSISFTYSFEKSADDYCDFFDQLMQDSDFNCVLDEMISEQLVNGDTLEDAVSLLAESLTSSAGISVESLDRELFDVITRVVNYRHRKFVNSNSEMCIEIKSSAANDFPVIGIELWQKGKSVLPGGMLAIQGEDLSIVNSIANAITLFNGAGN